MLEVESDGGEGRSYYRDFLIFFFASCDWTASLLHTWPVGTSPLLLLYLSFVLSHFLILLSPLSVSSPQHLPCGVGGWAVNTGQVAVLPMLDLVGKWTSTTSFDGPERVPGLFLSIYLAVLWCCADPILPSPAANNAYTDMRQLRELSRISEYLFQQPYANVILFSWCMTYVGVDSSPNSSS